MTQTTSQEPERIPDGLGIDDGAEYVEQIGDALDSLTAKAAE